MNEKKSIKQSEARILVYLSVVHNTRKHVTEIAHRLEIDYSYVMRVLQAMVHKGWLKKHQYRRHMFYDLTEFAPVEEAKKLYQTEQLQQTLIDSCTQADMEVKMEETAKVMEDERPQISE